MCDLTHRVIISMVIMNTVIISTVIISMVIMNTVIISMMWFLMLHLLRISSTQVMSVLCEQVIEVFIETKLRLNSRVIEPSSHYFAGF